MDSPTTTMENEPTLPLLPPKSHQDTTENPHSTKNSSQLRGSGSYPTMIRARTTNRNKITKRTSDSMIITGRNHYHHGHHVTGSSSGGGGTMVSDGNTRSAPSKKRKLLNNKKTVFSKASRRKSLENLGLLVRNRCGTAKLQWPSEKKETDVFDLLPEGCMQVRQLIRLKSRGGGGGLDGSGDHYQCGGGSSDFYNNVGGDRNKDRYKEEDASCDELEGNSNKAERGKGSLASEARLQGRRSETSSYNANSQTDWKNKKNISVIVRIRPKQDKERVEKSIVFRTDSKTIVFDPKEKTKDFYFQGVKQLTRSDFGRKRPNRNVSFQYDKVYGPEATNKEIFEEMLKDLTDHLIEGYNSTVFAYGATGSGKTYTMIGSNSNPGLTVLMVESLYKRIDDLAEEFDCEVVCSYLEVYNETIKDLLRPDKELSIREDGKKGIIISELSFYKPRGPQELLKLLRSGNRARTQHATDLNAESSRSHAVFEVKLCLKRKRNKKCQQKEGSRSSGDRRKKQEQAQNIKNDEDEDDEDVCRRCGCSGGGCVENECDDDDDEHDGINKVEVIQSKLVMVDLAGSERGTAASSNHHGGVFVDGARQREGASINKSLLALASCISALADGKCHVPYRNSKLTRLLKDSLNGVCTTVMIANISPSALTSEDTYNTLKYADRAKSIVGPVAKQKNVFMEDLIVEDSAKTQMVELQVKNVQLQEQLEEEKLKRELILKELQDLQRKNVEMKSEAGQEERNVLLGRSFKMKGIRGRRKGIIGGNGDEPPHQEEVETGDDAEECCFTGKNATALTEDQLPPQIQQYIEISRERANIFSEYAGFASETRFSEWAISCKKLKADMADFLGRLPVEDENYIWFSKLKNEVNNSSGAYRNTNSLGALADAKKNDHHHKKYAVKLKNLTERLELIRQNCVENNLLPGYDHDSGEVLNSQKMVAITLEQFLEYKNLYVEHEGNEKVNQFYQQFCQRINNQLITSGMTLMNALKLVKSVYLQLRQVEESAVVSGAVAGGGKGIILPPTLQQEYKELLDLVYGPGPPVSHQWQEDKEITAGYKNDNNNISSNVNNDNLPKPLSALPQNPPQLSNLGRKSSPVMDDLVNMRKLVERPLLIQLTSLLGTAEEETEIKRSAIGTEEDEGEGEDIELRSKREMERSNSTFSRVVTTAATTTRKSLSTSHTIYEPTQPPPVTRVRGGESSPELQLSSHPHSTCAVEQGEEEEGDDEAETRYNDDDDVEDNDHHYLRPPCVIDNDDDSTSFPSNGPFQVETSVAVTANGNSGNGIMWDSLPGTTTNSTMSASNLSNPVKRKNSTSFEIIFDRKEEKRVGGRGGSVKPGRLSRIKDKTSTPFGPSVMSALSKQKISENHFNNEECTTATSSSGTVTTSSASTSAENVRMMMKENNKTGSATSIGGVLLGSDQQKKSIGNRKRLVDQALIKDYQRSQTKTEKTPADEMVPVQGENDNKNCQEYDEEEEMERGNPSSYIYQLDSMLSPSSIDVLEGTRGMSNSKRGFGNADSSSLGKIKVKSCSATKGNKMDLEADPQESNTNSIKVRNNTTSTPLHHKPNPNPIRRRGHLKQQQQEEEEKRRQLPPTAMGSKPDIGSSWRNNHQRQQHQQQQCSNTRSSNKNTGGDGGKSLNPSLSEAAGAGVITSTTPPEFSMSVQGQRKNQTQRLLQYKVTLPVKTSIALHPSKASTDLTARSSDKVDVYRQQKIIDHHHYPPEQKHQHSNSMVMMVGSEDEESEWEVHNSNNSKVINMPNTKSTSKQRHGSQHSLLSSARSTMSHQKAPYHTNCKTFTISRESLPVANMPVISSVPGNINPNKYRVNSRIPTIETPYKGKQWDPEQKGESEANYYSSNEDEGEGGEIEGNNGNYTSEDDATSCYSDECH